MKKTNFTMVGRFTKLFLFTLALGAWMLPGQALAQNPNCSLACTSLSQISLDENCDTEVTWNMILNAERTSCPQGSFVVKISKYKNGPAIPSSPFVNKSNIGETLTVEVMDEFSRNRCWGQITVEDKMPPRIECSNDTLYCHEMRNYAGPLATDNCQKAAFLHATRRYPWNGGPLYNDYRTSMDAVFGEGNWDDLQYNTLNPELVFSKAYCYIYMEGSDLDGFDFANFLNANRQLVEDWVRNGGRLLMNVAPQTGPGSINLGFGGVVVTDQGIAPNARPVDPNHPVIMGPSQPVGNFFTANGNQFGRYFLTCPPNVSPILQSTANQDVLSERTYGDGFVLFGTLVATGFMHPQPNVQNLKKNILTYLKNLGGADVTITLLDEDIVPLNCDEFFVKRVTRTYIATDASGNQSEPCTYEILLRRFPGNQVEGPDDRSVVGGNPVHCDEVVTLPNGDLDPAVYGVPTIDGVPLWPNQDFYCNVTVTYEDIDFGYIGCTRKVMRMWTVREWWCSEEVETPRPQLIEITDNEGPEFDLPRDMTVTTSAGYKCEAIVQIPPFTITDACSQTTTVDVQFPGGFIKNWTGQPIRLPVGPNEVVFTAYDGCYNATEQVMLVTVEDKTAPVAVCDQHTVVALTYDGTATVYAQTFDDGSFDDCWIDSMAVRRMGPTEENCDVDNDQFRGFVTFCCEDVALGNLMVVFRVWDENNNYNDCMVSVDVQDKLPPVISCPPNLTISCDYHLDRNDLSDFGDVVTDKSLQQPLAIAPPYLINWSGPLYDGIAHDNCDPRISRSSDFNITQCNTGSFTRTFTVSDDNGSVSCTQYIEVRNPYPFNPSTDIIWPRDTTTLASCFTGDLHPDNLGTFHGYPRITEDKCDLVGTTWEDDVYPFAGNEACFKVIRTWKVIDWCQFNNGRYMEWTYQQVLKVNNNMAPTVLSPIVDNLEGPNTYCTYDATCSGLSIPIGASAFDDCTPANELSWKYQVDLNSTGTFGTPVTGIGEGFTVNVFFPVGTHTVRYTFEDRCGNAASIERTYTILNCKAPLAYCANGIIVDLMRMQNGGMVEVWAEDLDAGSSHPCGYDLEFTFDSLGQVPSVIYTCDDLALNPGGAFTVTVWITSPANGQQSACVNTIFVQDNDSICPPFGGTSSALIGGLIETEDAEAVSKVEVKLEGAGAMSFTTNNDGFYAFPPMPFGGNYNIIPERNDDFMNGVSTADLVAIQRHLLGIQEITSPYKMIAADVNNSKDISARDISELRKLILGIQDEIPGNTSWRFVDKAFVFNDPANALKSSFPEAYPISGLNANMNVNFVAVKVGDINGSASPNQLMGTQVRSLAGQLKFEVDAASYQIGDLISVPFYAANFNEVTGYQFTLHFDLEQMSFAGIKAGQLDVNEGNFGLNRLENGIITTSWNGQTDAVNAEEPLFTLEFRANRAGSLVDELFISSDVTAAEAYNQANELLGVQLKYRTNNSKGVFALYQNTPNPFADETFIRFSLESAEQANLTIYDVNGKVIRRYEIDGAKGMNEIRIASGELSAAGVLYYQLDTRNHTATKRMVVLK